MFESSSSDPLMNTTVNIMDFVNDIKKLKVEDSTVIANSDIG